MRTKILGMLTLALFLGAQAVADDAATKKELERHQGDWVAVSVEKDGKKLPDEITSSITRNVKGNAYTISREGMVLGKGTFTVDATKKPMTIDITRLEPEKDEPVKGIFTIEGDTYKVCYGGPGKDRPTEFVAKEGTTLATWKKAKK